MPPGTMDNAFVGIVNDNRADNRGEERTETPGAVQQRQPAEVSATPVRTVPSALPAVTESDTKTDLPEDRYFNRELSWLDFNARVLAQGCDPSQPLLERLRFFAIFASNLDEFYMVRVAGLKRRDEAGLSVRSADGLTPREQLAYISKRNQELVGQHSSAFADDILPALAENGIRIVTWEQLTSADRTLLTTYFGKQVFPVLTPLAVDPAHPFPYISGLSLNLAVAVRDPAHGAERFARVKVPNNVPRLIRVETDREAPPATFIPLEALIAAHLDDLFPGMEVVEHHVFRVTRNADFDVEEDRDEDLLQAMERELAQRRFGPPVRLEIASDFSERMLELLQREMEVDPHDVVPVSGLLDLTCLWELHALDRKELKDAPFIPATHPAFGERETPKSVFATLREGDVLVHHPYDAFSTSVQRFIEQAAADPRVLAIKQTLYRTTSQDSAIVNALIDAAEAGKQVVALVEIKARFDEQANIAWARALEQAGVHVVYGLVGLKTHCKICLVVRGEGATIRRYCHIGTGNYNAKTARQYEDLGLLTADGDIGSDLTDLFNVLTGYSRQSTYRSILTSPEGIRNGIVARIDGEVERARKGENAGIRVDDLLVDEQVIDALYRASGAGVDVDIVVRGICSLRPGLVGLSENIRVRSILGRFLEHSRIFSFTGGGERWIGSADMMHRNLDRRVEVLVRVRDPELTAQLDNVLDACMDPATRAWVLGPDGEWEPQPADRSTVRDLQVELMRRQGGTE